MIGPHFAEELAAAGLLGLPFAWSADGHIEYGPTLTQQQRDAIAAVLAAHDHTLPATDIDAVRDAYVQAKAAVQAMVADPNDLPKARTAIVRIGQCLEELLKALNRRFS